MAFPALRGRAARAVLAGMLGLSSACHSMSPSADRGMILSVESPIALGGRGYANVRDACPATPSCIDPSCCTTQSWGIVSAVIADPSILDATLLGLAVGTTRITVTARSELGDEETQSADVSVVEPEAAILGRVLFGSASCAEPELVPTGQSVTMEYLLLYDGRPLDSTGPFLLASTIATLDDPPGEYGRIRIVTGSTPGVGSVTVPVGAPAVHDLELYEPSQVDGIAFTGPITEVRVGDCVRPSAVPTVGGRTPCRLGPMHLTVDTPATCSFSPSASLLERDMTDLAYGQFVVCGVAPGTCRVRASVTGGTASAMYELPVVP